MGSMQVQCQTTIGLSIGTMTFDDLELSYLKVIKTGRDRYNDSVFGRRPLVSVITSASLVDSSDSVMMMYLCGWARSQLGNVLVEKRPWTRARWVMYESCCRSVKYSHSWDVDIKPYHMHTHTYIHTRCHIKTTLATNTLMKCLLFTNDGFLHISVQYLV